ncbi:MAG: undecaprenyldiphospho-muramoylpentapeptide beta-N-acetylglucosaminyltransferase [Alphaproteobacteria bacterium]
MSGGPEIVLAAGGTGGHVFPAQALAGELAARGRSLALITDRRGAGYGGALGRIATYQVHAGTISGRSLGGKIAGLAELAMGFLEARRLLSKLEPAAVVGFGGYPSLPTLLAAARAGMTTLIHEQNAMLGRVNRLLAPRVTLIATSYPETARLKARHRAKATLTGNPVRSEIRILGGHGYRAPARRGPFALLVIGGSQGARVLSRVVPAALGLLPVGLRRSLKLSQQCRADDIDRVRGHYEAASIDAELATFFDDIPARLAAAHLVIARAGASTVSELAVAGRPAILVPYRFAADGHQSLNARALAEAGGAWRIEEEEFAPEPLARRLEALLEDPEGLEAAAQRARAMARPEAAANLADLVERLAPANGGRGTGVRLSEAAREEAA